MRRAVAFVSFVCLSLAASAGTSRGDFTRGTSAGPSSPHRVCNVFPGRPTDCFRTAREADANALLLLLQLGPTVTCSTPLKLRNLANQGGTLVNVYSRSQWINLSTLSFDNKTSSFTVGACAVELAAGVNGSANWYPECTNAGCVENSMLPGWDNVLSSVYLY
jgi:hypothetical protein